MSHTWKKRVIGLGGTFDHFHAGHKHFLDFAAQQGGLLKIGITSDKMVQSKKLPQLIQPFPARKQAVTKYCHDQGYNYQVVPLEDAFGPAVTDSKMFGLALTENTLANGQKINILRQKLNLRPLETSVASLKKDQSGQPISSTRIRTGEINRDGVVYAQILEKTIKLTTSQKDFFSQPQGKYVEKPTKNGFKLPVWVVGDTSLEKFITNAWEFGVGVYDLKQQRQPITNSVLNTLKPNYSVANPAGLITHELVNELLEMKPNSPKYLFVDGEEDLAAVALVLLLPLHSLIYYGQPDKGMVVMEVTERLKETVYNVLTSID